MKRLGIAVLVVVVAVIGYRTARLGRASGPPAPLVRPEQMVEPKRPEAADFTLKDLEGNPVTLSDFKGKVVLVDFWATWCPPCVAEVPHFKSLHKEYNAQGFEIIGISLDKGGVPVVRDFVEEREIPYINVMGTREVTLAYGGIRGIPTTFLIDREGRVAEKWVGFHEEGEFARAIEKLLEEEL